MEETSVSNLKAPALGSVGVVIPFKDDATGLRRMLESLYNQTCPAQQIVVVDDGSSQEQAADLDEILNQYQNIELITRAQNGGAAAACNDAIEVISTEYICFLSANDWTLPTYFEQTCALMGANPGVAICISKPHIFYEAKNRFMTANIGLSQHPKCFSPDDAERILRWNYFTVQTNSSIFRSDFVRRVSGMPAELESFADNYLAYQAMLTSGFCYVPAPLAVYVERHAGYSYDFRQNRLKREALTQSFMLAIKDDPVLARLFRAAGICPFIDLKAALFLALRRQYRYYLTTHFLIRSVYVSGWAAVRDIVPNGLRSFIRRSLSRSFR